VSRSHRSREDVRSFAVSLGVHALLLLVLSWFVVTSVRQPTISLSASTAAPAEDAVLLSLTPLGNREPRDAKAENLIDVDPLQHGTSFASLNANHLRPRFERKSVEFFGTQAYGNRFVYILDRSISMSVREGDRFDRARDELIRSISSLTPDQSYCVFLFCYRTTKMFGNVGRHPSPRRSANAGIAEFIEATPDNLHQLRYWLRDVSLDSGTDPRRALSLAHSMNPDAIFLLSDGDFNRPGRDMTGEGWIGELKIPRGSSVHEGIKLALSDVPIHTIAFENAFTRTMMNDIAEATGGSNRYVKTRSLEPKVAASLINALQQIRTSQRFPERTMELRQVIRLRYAKTLIEDGELAFAEYLLRPTRDFRFDALGHRRQATEMYEILASELDDVRVEDFKSVSLDEIERRVQLGRSVPRFESIESSTIVTPCFASPIPLRDDSLCHMMPDLVVQFASVCS
jgi:hypothetical protein